MPAWARSPDFSSQDVKGEIENKSKKQGWDQLSHDSSKIQLSNGEDERHKFISYLAHQYPVAQKDPTAWFKSIKKTTGQAKDWNSCFTAYTQAVNETQNLTHNLAVSDARRKRKDGAVLSQDFRKARGLELTPEEEKLLSYSLRRDIALSDARRKHKEGARLSHDERRARGLELTPEEEQ